MGDAFKCDKCGNYFEKRPDRNVDLGQFVMSFVFGQHLTDEEKGTLEIKELNSPIPAFMISEPPKYKKSDICGGCQRDLLSEALKKILEATKWDDLLR